MGSDKQQWSGEIISIFWSLIRTNCDLWCHHAPSFTPNLPSEKQPASPVSLANWRIHMDSNLKKSLLTCFESYWVSPIPHVEC